MIYVNDVGTLILVNLGAIAVFEEDELKLNVRKPSTGEDSTTWTIWDASIYSSSNPTQVYYISDASTFDEPGTYTLQAEVIRDNGRWLGGVASFNVKSRWT
jgi:hypothetical protein